MGTQLVTVVRKDLNMSKGKCSAQVAHAVVSVVLQTLVKHNLQDTLYVKDGFTRVKTDPHRIARWLNEDYKKIVLYVKSEEELLALKTEADKRHWVNAYIIDNGLTMFDGVPTATCIAFEPMEKELIDIITGGLPLL